MMATSTTFASPHALWGLIPVAILAARALWRRRQSRDPVFGFSSLGALASLPRTVWARVHWLPDALRLSALTLMVVAIARPQIPSPPVPGETEGIDIVLALDTSGSMQAADFQPNDRMFVAKKAIQEFIRTRTSDRVGLVVFAGEAASWSPLTLDYALVAQLLDEVNVGMLPDGTAIGSAIATSLNRLRRSDAKSRVIVLLTDGDNNSGAISPVKAAEMAKDLGIQVYTILIGRGGPVPFPTGKDIFGRVLMQTRRVPVNPELLKTIAQTTGGESYEASDAKELDARLSDVLDELERTRHQDIAQARPAAELFPYLLVGTLLLLALEGILRMTRLSRFP
ncbi:MAG: VWA domain-containing protein [Deltaproteobacteria bacterium]|nr:VWA domain-containing protein [Deltaproteobacteria bacterium]